jgi:tRNA pseudouridine38-40 synthase
LLRNLKLVLEYDGTDFCGWQIQPGVRTVQEELQKSLKKIFQHKINITGAGRTDSGVHARGQVASFKIDTAMPSKTIFAALNGTLPKDVRIISAEDIDIDFNPRYDAIKRHYCYYITRRERAIYRNFMWCFKDKLDVKKMQQASNYLAGKQDFKSFCQAGADLDHHFCTVKKIKWELNDDVLTLNIIANRFIHSMVRIIVGTIVDVGRDYTSVEKIPEILVSRDRRKAGQTAPAKGLFLEKIFY